MAIVLFGGMGKVPFGWRGIARKEKRRKERDMKLGFPFLRRGTIKRLFQLTLVQFRLQPFGLV